MTWTIFSLKTRNIYRALARRIAEEKVMPVRAELDEKETFPGRS